MLLRSALVLALSLGIAAPALAAKGGGLTATNNTIAGPGSARLAAGSIETVFTYPGATDVCITVVNTGKAPVTIELTGASSTNAPVAAGGSRAVCSDDTTTIQLSCDESAACSAEWRVDDV